jgi:predicted  nucleic acid-binding Zn-ribbon protein
LTRALAALPAGVAADFERLVGRAHGPALLLDQPTHCPACHVRLAAQLESRVRNRSVIFACPRCLHLLYRVQPAQEEPRLARTPERDVHTRSNAL